MQRYVFSSRTGCVNEHPDGKWVLARDAQAEIARLTAERDDWAYKYNECCNTYSQMHVALEEAQDERDQALASAAAAAMEMRERAAEHAWNKRDLLADAEKKQIDAGLSGRDYYGRRLEAELLSRSIRALPIDPDAQKALDRLLAEAFKAGQRGMRERAAEKCKWHSDKLVETIRALPIKERSE